MPRKRKHPPTKYTLAKRAQKRRQTMWENWYYPMDGRDFHHELRRWIDEQVETTGQCLRFQQAVIVLLSKAREQGIKIV